MPSRCSYIFDNHLPWVGGLGTEVARRSTGCDSGLASNASRQARLVHDNVPRLIACGNLSSLVHLLDDVVAGIADGQDLRGYVGDLAAEATDSCLVHPAGVSSPRTGQASVHDCCEYRLR